MMMLNNLFLLHYRKFTRFWRLLNNDQESIPKILMVSTEYPPMRGGVGRYTFNLVRQSTQKRIECSCC